MRKMALDVGDVRIGVATSDMLSIIAGGYETYIRRTPILDVQYIVQFAKDHEVDTIVFGLPINMNGTEGERVRLVRELANNVSALTSCMLAFQDERLTTVSAERVLIEADMRREKRKKYIDKVAATIILQSYLDRINYYGGKI